MACLEDRKNVRKFLEDLLDESEYQRVRLHLEHCDACAQFTRAAGSISSMLMELGRGAALDGLSDSAVFLYEKKRRSPGAVSAPHVAASVSDVPPPPPPLSFGALAPPPPAAPAGLKIVAAVLALLVMALLWRDFTRDPGRPQPAVSPPPPPAPSLAPAETALPSAIRGDFEWGNIHLRWPGADRQTLSELIRRLELDIRYEAPGLVVVRVPVARDAQWRLAWLEASGSAIEEMPAGASDLLYSIDYRQDS